MTNKAVDLIVVSIVQGASLTAAQVYSNDKTVYQPSSFIFVNLRI